MKWAHTVSIKIKPLKSHIKRVLIAAQSKAIVEKLFLDNCLSNVAKSLAVIRRVFVQSSIFEWNKNRMTKYSIVRAINCRQQVQSHYIMTIVSRRYCELCAQTFPSIAYQKVVAV